MKRKFFVSMLALVVLGFSACCSDCNKCCEKEASECSKKRAKHFTEMLTERLELTAEQAESVEKLMVSKFDKEAADLKAFHVEMEKILGAEKAEMLKTVFKDCPKKRPHHCPSPAMEGCCKGKKQCMKADSCKQACDKAVCPKMANEGCKKECPKCPKK